MQTAEQLNFRLYVIKQILVPAHSFSTRCESSYPLVQSTSQRMTCYTLELIGTNLNLIDESIQDQISIRYNTYMTRIVTDSSK